LSLAVHQYTFAGIDRGQGHVSLSGNPGSPIFNNRRATAADFLATIQHDSNIAEFCHVAPCAVVLGGASIGANSLVGANATVLPNSNVPANYLVKAVELFGNSQ
jgi:carbonic anhydrase/acetyltransferase-like protein (isoleucine patch superfamily)